jgi:hypothetical protein
MTTALLGPDPAGVIDEDAAHGLGRGREELLPVIPGRPVRPADESQVRLVDECGGVQGVVWSFGGHAGRGEFPQFVVDQREQLRGGLTVATVRCFQESRHVGHFGGSGRGVAL